MELMTSEQFNCYSCESRKFCYECKFKDVVIPSGENSAADIIRLRKEAGLLLLPPA